MPPNELKALLVEDSRGEAALVRELLSASIGDAAQVVWVEDTAAALAALRGGAFDVVLLDLTLPDSHGLQTVRRVQEAAAAIPVIVLTGLADEELAQAALRQGAQDYLVKGKYDGTALMRAIRYAIDRKRAEEDLRRARDELEVRVEERTEELNHTVEDLQEEVERRTVVEEMLQARTAKLRELAGELTLVEQRERRRMAEVLHDHLQQLLVGAKFRVRPLQQAREPALREAAAEVDDLISQCIEVSRSLTGELSPPILHEGGLIPALEWLVRWMKSKHGLEVELEVLDLLAPQSENITVLLFQSVRELLFNVVKHAAVKKAHVEVRRRGQYVQVRVQDEGAGFDPPAAFQTGGPKGGYGLFSIRERLDLMGGRMDIRSRPGKGSRFTLLAPLGPADAAGPLPPPEADPVREPSEAGAAAPAGRKIRVLLADAHAVVRRSMAHALSSEPDMEVVAEADDDAAALEMARASAPDVAILEVGETNRGGLATIRRFRAELPHVRLIGLSMFEDERLGQAVLAAGAAKYLCQTGPSAALVSAVRECGRNGRAKEDPPPDGGQKIEPEAPPKRGRRPSNRGGEEYAGA